MRENFWNTLCSISDYSSESITRLNATFTIPDTLCRFRSVSTYTLWQLQENIQFFSTADHYDDPFDTYFKIDFQSLKFMYKSIKNRLVVGNTDAIRDTLSKVGFDSCEIDEIIKNLSYKALDLPQIN